MEKYLKMSDFVVGKVQLACNRNFDVCISYDCVDPDMIVRKTMDAMEHAINSHDELVAMNKELLEALEAISFEDRAWQIPTREEIRELIAKAKAAA